MAKWNEKTKEEKQEWLDRLGNAYLEWIKRQPVQVRRYICIKTYKDLIKHGVDLNYTIKDLTEDEIQEAKKIWGL